MKELKTTMPWWVSHRTSAREFLLRLLELRLTQTSNLMNFARYVGLDRNFSILHNASFLHYN